jgi:hypothetical protein
VQGIGYEITEAVDRQSMLARQLPVWPLPPGQREHCVGVHPTEVSGRRFIRLPLARRRKSRARRPAAATMVADDNGPVRRGRLALSSSAEKIR